MLDHLGQDAHGDLGGRGCADVEPRGRVQPSDPIVGHTPLRQRPGDRRRPLAARDQADMPRATPENLLEGLLVSAPVRADHRRRQRDRGTGGRDLRAPRRLRAASRRSRSPGRARQASPAPARGPPTRGEASARMAPRRSRGCRHYDTSSGRARGPRRAAPRAPPSPTRATRRGWPSRSAFNASRTTTGSAQAPPTQPVTAPSPRISALAPGLAEVGRSHRTTVASAKASPRPPELHRQVQHVHAHRPLRASRRNRLER